MRDSHDGNGHSGELADGDALLANERRNQQDHYRSHGAEQRCMGHAGALHPKRKQKLIQADAADAEETSAIQSCAR